MRIAVLQTLAGAFLLGSAFHVQAGEKSLGNVMCIGDSISHGFAAPSYRWQLHKVLVDNGVEYKFVGVNRGNRHPVLQDGTPYRGVAFDNCHAAMSGERAYEIAGRINKSGRLADSNIFDWLLLDKTYEGPYKLASAADYPNVVLILIGTNDIVIDGKDRGSIAGYMDTVTPAMIGAKEHGVWNGKGDLDTIIGAIRQVNPDAGIYIMAVPTWSDRLNRAGKAEDFAAVAAFNEKLLVWAAQNSVAFVAVNDGMVDVSRTDKPFAAEEAFFNQKDHLHPTRQGDLVMAANVAKAMGFPGRNAGLERAAVQGEVQNARTVEIAGTVGDGAEGGWEAADLVTLSFAAAGWQGKLSFSESALKWNGQTLFCADFSANKEPVRIAYIGAENAAGVDAGFYVWIGGRLVGEALQGAPGAEKDGYKLESARSAVSVSSAEKALAPKVD